MVLIMRHHNIMPKEAKERLVMRTSKWVNENLNASAITLGAIKDEVIEVLVSKSLAEVKEEVADVLYFSYSWLQSKTGISLYMVGATPTIRKVEARLEAWKEIFSKHSLVFDKKYLVNGSNYAKQVKIDMALALARAEQVVECPTCKQQIERCHFPHDIESIERHGECAGCYYFKEEM